MSSRAVGDRLAAVLHETVTSLPCGQRIGVDAVHIATWERHLMLGGELLLRRTYRAPELAFCVGRMDRLATRLAGKESVLKVLGTGIRGVGLIDIEIRSLPSGRPTVVLHGPAQELANAAGLRRIEVSLCHESGYALAAAIGVGGGGGDE